MTPGPSFERLEAGLREAIAGNDWERAAPLWAAYAACLQAAVGSDPSAGARLQEARALIDWTRQTRAAERARMVDELASLHICLRYSDAAAPRHRILRLRA